MLEIDIFRDIENSDVKKMMHCFNANFITYKKDRTIISNLGNVNMVGIILKGSAHLIRYDYDGNRTLLDKLSVGDLFGEIFTPTSSSEQSIIAISDCEILFIDYNKLINRCKKNCSCHNLLINNMLKLLAKKIASMNEKIEVLDKRSIREKLLKYFNILSQKVNSKTFYLPFSYTDLADYLSIDRSAMMREIKNLKDEGFIKANKKKITLCF